MSDALLGHPTSNSPKGYLGDLRAIWGHPWDFKGVSSFISVIFFIFKINYFTQFFMLLLVNSNTLRLVSWHNSDGISSILLLFKYNSVRFVS